jgi:hypothetical protein
MTLASGGPRLSSQHLGVRGSWISEFKASLVYRVSSRTAKATQRNPVLKKKSNYRKKERHESSRSVSGIVENWISHDNRKEIFTKYLLLSSLVSSTQQDCVRKYFCAWTGETKTYRSDSSPSLLDSSVIAFLTTLCGIRGPWSWRMSQRGEDGGWNSSAERSPAGGLGAFRSLNTCSELTCFLGNTVNVRTWVKWEAILIPSSPSSLCVLFIHFHRLISIPTLFSNFWKAIMPDLLWYRTNTLGWWDARRCHHDWHLKECEMKRKRKHRRKPRKSTKSRVINAHHDWAWRSTSVKMLSQDPLFHELINYYYYYYY